MKTLHTAWPPLVLALGCQTELPTEPLLDDTPPTLAATRPPPISGGTLLVTGDAKTAVVADPERDRVLVVSLGSREVCAVELAPGDEPGRLIEGPEGTVFVASRRGGEVITIDLDTCSLGERRPVCDAPRGLAFDGRTSELHVACASGELVSFAVGGALSETRRLVLEPDLRDVLVVGEQLAVTHFRSSRLSFVGSAGAIERELSPPNELGGDGSVVRVPRVAWRAVPRPQGGLVVVHQTAIARPIDLAPREGVEGEHAAPYGGDCSQDLVRAEVTSIDAAGNAAQLGPAAFRGLHLPVDLAVAPDGKRAIVVDPAAGEARDIDLFDPTGEDCFALSSEYVLGLAGGTPIAAAYAGPLAVVQTREPAQLQLFDPLLTAVIPLGGESRADTGFDLFHNTDAHDNLSGLACASCHPEGREDGHTWNFTDEGPRRTQSLSGTLKGTAPFHWGGSFESMAGLMEEVSTHRMGGVRQSVARTMALSTWLEELPPVRGPRHDSAAISRGEKWFQDPTVGCATCHSGPMYTNATSTDVGRGEALQVPSLIGVGTRAPFMHDGCADTLLERFDPACAGESHGTIDHLNQSQLSDLVAFLLSL